jgi:hypothetical protein
MDLIALGPMSRHSARLFLQLSKLGPPPPHPQESVPPHPLVAGEGHTRLWERGWGGGSQFGRGDRLCGTLGIYVQCTWTLCLGRKNNIIRWTMGRMGEDCGGEGQPQRPYRQRKGAQVGDMFRPLQPIVQSNNGLLHRWVADGKNAPLLMRVRVEL